MKKLLFLGLLILGIGVLAMWLWPGSGTTPSDERGPAPTTDPLDPVSRFYNDWLQAVQSTTTDPYAAGLATNQLLSASLQQKLQDNQAATPDPVLCQPELPERVGAKVLYQEDYRAEVQVLGRGYETKSPHFALVHLAAVDGAWQIDRIECRTGESGPEREFSFIQSGQLLKSVPEPLNSEYWHLVFTENDVAGNAVPLFFSDSSQCVASDGSTEVCDPSQFSEAARATVTGNMTEAGVDVVEIQF